MSRSGPESPSTAKCVTVFGQLEVLSGKSRIKRVAAGLAGVLALGVGIAPPSKEAGQ